MAAYRTVVSSKGQVLIPAELRQRLSLEKGSRSGTLKQKHGLGYAHAFAPSWPLSRERGW